jgi:hypothetical protein
MPSSESSPPQPPPKPPFDISRVGMLLLAALIVGPLLIAMTVAIRCTIWFIPACEGTWSEPIIKWLSETMPVLVALILAGRRPPT